VSLRFKVAHSPAPMVVQASAPEEAAPGTKSGAENVFFELGYMYQNSISRPGDFPGLPRSGSRPLPSDQVDDFRTLKMAMSGNRPEVVRWVDDFRTVSGH
jgi:hypothetical protein